MTRGICTKEDEAKCRAEQGAFMKWACNNCPKARVERLHPYTIKLLRLTRLKKAGFTIQNNDLTLEEWFDLERILRWQEMQGHSTLRFR